MSDKLALVIDTALPLGLIANAAAYLSFSVGQRLAPALGPNVKDALGREHLGTLTLPIPILATDRAALTRLRDRAYDVEDLLVVDFSDAAQSSRTYPEYEAKLAAARPEDLTYLGLTLYGPKKLVNALTGSLALLR